MTEFTAPTHAGDHTTRLLVALCTLTMWLGLLGPAWAYSPHNPVTKAPAAEVNFAQLVAAWHDSPSTIQAAFYGWLAWLFALLATVLAVIAMRAGSAIIGSACVVLGVVEMIISVLAFKGAQSWSTIINQSQYIRVGAVLFCGGIIALIAVGVRCLQLTRMTLPPRHVSASTA